MIDTRDNNIWSVYIHIIPKAITKYNHDKYYIGITSKNPEERWRNGLGYYGQKHFYNAIKKYNWVNMEHHIIASNLTKSEACDMEKLLIFYLKSYDDEYGYNKTLGGEGVYGVKCSERQKKNMSERFSGKGNPFYGKHHSEETKEKLKSIPRKIGADHSLSKPIICLNTLEVFDCMREAAKYIGYVSVTALSKACRTGSSCGKHPETNEVLYWSYYEDGKEYEKLTNKKYKTLKVIELNSLKIFNDVKEASDFYNIPKPQIYSSCKNNDFSHGYYSYKDDIYYVFRYYDENHDYSKDVYPELEKYIGEYVVCIEDGIVFESQFALSEYYSDISSTMINKYLNNKYKSDYLVSDNRMLHFKFYREIPKENRKEYKLWKITDKSIKEKYGKNLGLFQSPYDPNQWKFKDAVPLAAFKIPDNYITPNAYKFGFDQKDSSQCAATSFSYIRMLQECENEQSELTEYLSPTWSYGLRVNGSYCGEGMYLSDVVRGGREFGSVLFNELEYPCSYPKAKKLAEEKREELLVKGDPFKISSYYTCNSRREIQIAIMETKAVMIGVPCFDSIFNPDEEGKVRFVKGQSNSGGHALCLVGWITDEEGFWWIIKNSWGKYTKHGDGSTFLLHESYPWMDSAYVLVDEITEMKFKEYKEKFYDKE